MIAKYIDSSNPPQQYLQEWTETTTPTDDKSEVAFNLSTSILRRGLITESHSRQVCNHEPFCSSYEQDVNRSQGQSST